MLLKSFKQTEDDAIIQENYYFETPDDLLRQNHSALRIRKRQLTYTLTLKQPNQVGLLETHQPLTKKEWSSAIDNNLFPSGPVTNQLQQMNIPASSIQFAGILKTSRIELPYSDGLVCFDKSEYFDQVDYEIEFEGTSEDHAKKILSSLLESFNISRIPADNKVKRFFTRKEFFHK